MTKILLSVIMTTVLLLVPSAFAQRAGQNPDPLVRFQNALDQDGFDVTPGGVAAARGRHQASSQVSVAEFTEELIGDLKQSGFQVGEGYPMLYEDACAKYTYPALQSCFGNNPVAPYVIPVVKAWPDDGSTNSVELGSRLVLSLSSADRLLPLVQGSPLRLSRTVASNLFILQAPDVRTALSEAQRLASLPEVTVCYPVMRRQIRKHGSYAPPPNDPYFTNQWPLEYRATNGAPLGPDLNVRAAWPLSRGEGVTIAVVDDGVELDPLALRRARRGYAPERRCCPAFYRNDRTCHPGQHRRPWRQPYGHKPASLFNLRGDPCDIR